MSHHPRFARFPFYSTPFVVRRFGEGNLAVSHMVWIRPARKRPKMNFGPKIGAMEIETITHGRKFETITHGRRLEPRPFV
jgi:hypothetical protein